MSEANDWEVAVGDDGTIYSKTTSEREIPVDDDPGGIDFVDRSQARMAAIAIISMLMLGATTIILALRL